MRLLSSHSEESNAWHRTYSRESHCCTTSRTTPVWNEDCRETLTCALWGEPTMGQTSAWCSEGHWCAINPEQGVAADLASKLNILMNTEDCYTHTLIHTSHQSLYHLRTDLEPHLPPKPLSPFCLYCFHTSLYLSWWFPLVTIFSIYWVLTTWESMLSTVHLSLSLK